jgi:hypothetical protein
MVAECDRDFHDKTVKEPQAQNAAAAQGAPDYFVS